MKRNACILRVYKKIHLYTFVGQSYCINEDIMKELALGFKLRHFVKTIAVASVRKGNLHMFTIAYLGLFRTDYKHLQTFSLVSVQEPY
jgi:hypothetical protein